MPQTVTVRAAEPADLPELAELIREHAAYERAAPPRDDLADGLARLLFGPTPRLHAFVADGGADLLGYATASLEASTWQGAEFLHMDCLFLRPAARGAGIGGSLVDTLRDLARELGARELRWQTPDWNEGAIRFYDRTGASRSTKQRYTLTL